MALLKSHSYNIRYRDFHKHVPRQFCLSLFGQYWAVSRGIPRLSCNRPERRIHWPNCRIYDEAEIMLAYFPGSYFPVLGLLLLFGYNSLWLFRDHRTRKKLTQGRRMPHLPSSCPPFLWYQHDIGFSTVWPSYNCLEINHSKATISRSFNTLVSCCSCSSDQPVTELYGYITTYEYLEEKVFSVRS